MANISDKSCCELCGKLFRGLPFPLIENPMNPECCGQETRRLTRPQAEAVEKLPPEKRILWLHRGGHVTREPGRKWRPAQSKYQIEQAIRQLELHQQTSMTKVLQRKKQRQSADIVKINKGSRSK